MYIYKKKKKYWIFFTRNHPVPCKSKQVLHGRMSVKLHFSVISLQFTVKCPYLWQSVRFKDIWPWAYKIEQYYLQNLLTNLKVDLSQVITNIYPSTEFINSDRS